MNFAYLMVAGLALAAGPHAVISASPERQSAAIGDVDIIVDALVNHVTRMRGAGTSKRGRGGNTPFGCAINPYPVRAAVALSVDGLNTIDARRFEFTTEARSYGQALGRTANLGVISAVFFTERAPAVMRDSSKDDRGRRPAPPSSAPVEEAASAAAKRADDEFAATGMGRPTDHAVTQVWLDLEDAPAQTVNIRYEFRPQLVRLGIPAARFHSRSTAASRARARIRAGLLPRTNAPVVSAMLLITAAAQPAAAAVVDR